MNWKERGLAFLNSIKQDRSALALMRDDLNDNITECSKLLYRLEETESALVRITGRVEFLENPNTGQGAKFR